MELENILKSLIEQIPVIAVLAWLVVSQKAELRDWQQRYFDLNQKLMDLMKEQMQSIASDYRTVTAIERRRSEYDMREYNRVFDTPGSRKDSGRKESVQEVGLQSLQHDQSKDVES